MPISNYDRANISQIIGGSGTWFTARLLRLIASADPINRDRIRIAFPAEVAEIERWEATNRQGQMTWRQA